MSKSKIINGYQITQRLGTGSFAEVFKCIKLLTSQIFALKIFKDLKGNDPQKIKKQVDIVKQLDHHNIIRCFDFFQDEEVQNKFYAVFQYCGKGNLHDYMKDLRQKKTKIPQIFAKSCIFKILRALIYLHQQKIAHRDLKLANILIDDDYEIKLADFGLSKSYDEEQMLKTYCGTPLTMAPQILKKQKYTEKCDTWSFGVISYYILFSQHPYIGNTIQQLLNKIQNQKGLKFPPNTQISEKAQDFVSKCLTIDPKQRLNVQQLKKHEWFQQAAMSSIRTKFMKHSMGQQSQIKSQLNSLINYSINKQINNILLITNLIQNKTNSIEKGFEQFYKQKKVELFLFYFFAVHKTHLIENEKIKLFVEGKQFIVPLKSIKKFSNHKKHLVETIGAKVQLLNQSVKDVKESHCSKSYQILVKFIVDQAEKYIQDQEPKNIKRLKFFNRLLKFLNSYLKQPTIKIELKEDTKYKETKQQLQFYLANIFKGQMIPKIFNNKNNTIQLSQSVEQSLSQKWDIQYVNQMKQAQDDDNFRIVGEIIERGLTLRQISMADIHVQSEDLKQ